MFWFGCFSIDFQVNFRLVKNYLLQTPVTQTHEESNSLQYKIDLLSNK